MMTEACHNCRRQRLKCDRSLPHCLKCIKRNQECLGYQRLFRWELGIASRGKMAGKMLTQPLTDPLIQDLNYASRKYLLYFASHVCKDLVLYDIPKHNPFLELIPLTYQYPVLLQIIVANSALHMSNACQTSLVVDTTPVIRHVEHYHDALVAKQRALRLLKFSLKSIASADFDVTLAAVLLFIEFELIDSGRDDWSRHVDGARTIIETLCTSDTMTLAVMSPLRRCLLSNCMVFDILGSALLSSNGLPRCGASSHVALSLLQDAEGNHCSSFPAILLQIVQTGAQLSRHDYSLSPQCPSVESKQHQTLLSLLSTAHSFDPLVWATGLQSRSPASDLLHRTHIAFAHRAAVCIYLSRVLLYIYPTAQLSCNLESLVADIITHLSFIPTNDALFTATTWPAFISGAETNNRARQEWVTNQFRELWKVEPWGLLREALGVLQRIWLDKRSGVGLDGEERKMEGGNWIGQLRARGVDWLIV